MNDGDPGGPRRHPDDGPSPGQREMREDEAGRPEQAPDCTRAYARRKRLAALSSLIVIGVIVVMFVYPPGGGAVRLLPRGVTPIDMLLACIVAIVWIGWYGNSCPRCGRWFGLRPRTRSFAPGSAYWPIGGHCPRCNARLC